MRCPICVWAKFWYGLHRCDWFSFIIYTYIYCNKIACTPQDFLILDMVVNTIKLLSGIFNIMKVSSSWHALFDSLSSIPSTWLCSWIIYLILCGWSPQCNYAAGLSARGKGIVLGWVVEVILLCPKLRVHFPF